MALNCSSTSFTCSSAGRSASSSPGVGGGAGSATDEAADHGAALHQHQLLVLGQLAEGLGDARRQVVEVDLLHGRGPPLRSAFRRSRISPSRVSAGRGRGGGVGALASWRRTLFSSLTIRKTTKATIRNWMTVLRKAP